MEWGPPEWEFWAWAKASFCCRSLHPEVAKAHPCAHRSPTAEPSSLSCSSRAGRSIAGSSPGTQLPALRGRGLAGVRHSGEESKALAGSSPHLPVLLSLYSHCSCPPAPQFPLLMPPSLSEMLSRCLSAPPSPPVQVQVELWGQPCCTQIQVLAPWTPWTPLDPLDPPAPRGAPGSSAGLRVPSWPSLGRARFPCSCSALG